MKTRLVVALSALILTVSSAFAQTMSVKGVVSDDKGNTIPGAAVFVKGTTTGTVSSASGEYVINAAKDAVLEVSCLGYATQEVAVAGHSVINVVLQEDAISLSDVVVLGYGQATKKKDLSAAVGVISDPQTLAARPVTSALDMLQGQLAGVTITNNGGSPTESPRIVIRGQGSQKGDSVLWVVDGVPGAPIPSVNDIANIVVLKDAASAAIYGAQSGAGGVVLVTTKKASDGISLGYETVFGTRQATNLIQSCNAEEEILMRQTAYKNAGQTVADGWNPEKNPWIKTNRTNWMDELFRTSFYQRHDLSFNYGSEKFKTRLSVNYEDNPGVIVGTYQNNFNIHSNSSFQINKWVKFTEDINFKQTDGRGVNTDSVTGGAVLSAIYMPQSAEAYTADGRFGGTTTEDPEYIKKYGSNFADAHGDSINPLRTALADNTFNRVNTFWSTSNLEIANIVKGLRLNGRFSYGLGTQYYKNFTPMRTEVGKSDLKNSVNYNNYRTDQWKADVTLSYDRTFGKHTVGALAAFTADHYVNRWNSIESSGYSDESENLQYLAFASSITGKDGMEGPDANMALVGRISYSYDDRYFVTASWRRDYAGRLPDAHNYGDFPAFTGAWKISNEKFFGKNDVVSLLKLRGSWGRIGNLGSIAMNYKSPTLFKRSQNEISMYGIALGGAIGTMVSNSTALNNNLTWETSEQSNVGLDVDMFKSRLSMSFDFYNKRTFNLIQTQTMGWPSTIGVDAMLVNLGEVMNRGFEVQLGWRDKINSDWSYFINGNLSYNKNWVSDIGTADESGVKGVWTGTEGYRGISYFHQTAEGTPLNSYYLVRALGIFQTDEEAASYVDKNGNRIQPNAKAGDLKFEDFNPDGQITDADRQYMGNDMPDFTYALTFGGAWRGLSLSVLLQGVQGAQALYVGKYSILSDSDVNFNRSREILNAWSPTNTSSNIPILSKADANGNFTTASSWYLEDASYLRIKNVTLAYDMTKLIRKINHFNDRNSSLSVYFSGENLFTFTKYSGMDPECGGWDACKYPLSRVLSIGIKLNY